MNFSASSFKKGTIITCKNPENPENDITFILSHDKYFEPGSSYLGHIIKYISPHLEFIEEVEEIRHHYDGEIKLKKFKYNNKNTNKVEELSEYMHRLYIDSVVSKCHIFPESSVQYPSSFNG